MSFNVYVDFFEQIRLRFVEAMATSKFDFLLPLTFSADNVFIGHQQMAEGNDFLPSVQILFGGAEEFYDVIASNQMAATVTVVVRLHYPIDNPDISNKLYDSSAGSGMLYFIARTLDILNTRISDGLPDPRMLANAKKSMTTSIGSIDRMGDKLSCDITFRLNTKNFAINARMAI